MRTVSAPPPEEECDACEDEPHAVAAQQYLPDDLVGTRYYEPSDRGFERQVTDRLDRIRALLHPEPPAG